MDFNTPKSYEVRTGYGALRSVRTSRDVAEADAKILNWLHHERHYVHPVYPYPQGGY